MLDKICLTKLLQAKYGGNLEQDIPDAEFAAIQQKMMKKKKKV